MLLMIVRSVIPKTQNVFDGQERPREKCSHAYGDRVSGRTLTHGAFLTMAATVNPKIWSKLKSLPGHRDFPTEWTARREIPSISID